MGKFTLPLAGDDDQPKGAEKLVQSVGENAISRIIRVQVVNGRDAKGRSTPKLKIDNASPLLLNGIAVRGPLSKSEDPPVVLTGFSLPPRRTLAIPSSSETVAKLGLRKGVKVVAADLGSL